MGKFRKLFTWIGIAAFCGTAMFVAYDYIVNEPKTALVQQQLEKEFISITPPPGSTSSSFHKSHKPRQALVGSNYLTNQGYEDIRKYYDKELKNKGWQFKDETGIRDWGRDLGGKVTNYSKGEYTASIQYAGDPKGYGWVYALDLTWGLH